MADIIEAPPTEPAQNGFQVLVTRVKEWPRSRKIALAAVAILSMTLFGFIIIQARTADYQLLYGNLAEADAASVVEWLKANKIPYRLKNNGRNIAVPSDKVHEVRLSLAAAGLPEGNGVGFEIFDKQSFALTDFVQKINYTRALQGELARTIASLGPVETARVHLALPEKRLFKNQQKPATASVILKLRPGRQLASEQVQGIVHLVSSSIEGLSPEHVTVIDQNGTVLTRISGKGMIGKLAPDMLEFQLNLERHLEERAQALLDKAVGANNSMVRITTDLDFSQSEKTEEIFDPEEPVVRSEQISEEKSGSEIVGGVPGVQSNLQGNTSQAAGATPPRSLSKKTTNYEISKTISKTVNPVGTIKRVSVAVLVADRVIPATDKEPQKFEHRSPEELKAIETMITSALGLDKGRGDRIEVTSMPFSDTLQNMEDGIAVNQLYEFMPLIRYGLLLFGGLLIYFLMVRPLIKTLRQDVTQHFKTVEELEAEQKLLEQEPGQEEELPEIEQNPLVRIRAEVAEDPVFASHILKNWINQKS